MDKGTYEIKVVSHMKVEGHTEYLINIDNDKLDCHIFFTEKYSNLRNLYELMKKESKSKNFPSFPPNKLFGYEEENFVIQRTKDLNTFFQKISKDKNFSNLPSLNKFIDSNIEKSSIRKDVKKSSKHISKNLMENILKNKRYNTRYILFGKSLFQPDKKLKSEQSPDKFEKKFININYDIVINENNHKNETKYKKYFDNVELAFNDNKNIICSCDNDNFNLIGVNNNYIENEAKIMNLYVKKNLDKFKVLSNLIEQGNLYLYFE